MQEVKIVELKRSILEDNDADANVLREQLRKEGIYYINLMSAPGSGKTTFLVSLINQLKDKCSMGVMEADIDSDVDAYTIKNTGADAIQLHTGGMCHLDADMSRQGFKEFSSKNDIVVLENVGNLVCPAEFDTGAFLKLVILSVPEGDDKPLKYPLMFEVADAVIINKVDTIDYFDFNIEECSNNIQHLNPKAKIFTVSSTQGQGVKEVGDWIYANYQKWKGNI